MCSLNIRDDINSTIKNEYFNLNSIDVKNKLVSNITI